MKVYIGENEIKTLGHYITSGDIKDATLAPEEALSSKIFYNNNGKQTGTMADQGAVNATLNAGENYTIPKGYHNGSGKISANSLTSQTNATATAADIASGQTAWVNGEKLTGAAELYPFRVKDVEFTPLMGGNQYVTYDSFGKSDYIELTNEYGVKALIPLVGIIENGTLTFYMPKYEITNSDYLIAITITKDQDGMDWLLRIQGTSIQNFDFTFRVLTLQ